MKYITVDEYNTRVPSLNEDYFNELDNDMKESYLAIYSIYSKFLIEYFIKNYKLNEYDEVLVESPYSFIKVKEDDMDIYQYFALGKLNYLYIRNNLYVERLSAEEQTFLIEKASLDEIVYDDSVDEFIGSTFRRVMLENYEDEDAVSVCYGPDSSNYLAPNNAIVIGIRYDDYEKLPGESADDWAEANNNRLHDIESLSTILEARLSREIGIPTYAIKYNEFSVKKRSSVDVDLEKVM